MDRVIQLNATTGRSGLSIAEMAPTLPGPGEVRYRVSAFALNRADLMATENTHYFIAKLPCRIGWEACGVVDAVGDGVTDYKPGDRVTAIPGIDFDHPVSGEWAITEEAFLMPWPEGFSAAEATSLTMQAFTCYYPLKEMGAVGPGDWVLINAASSSAGVGAIQLAKLLGASVAAQTRSGAKRDFLLGLGADAVIATDHEDLTARLLEVTGGRGVRIVYDCYGGSFVRRYAGALAARGMSFVYGGMGGMQIEVPTLALIRPGAMLVGYSLINEVRERESLDRAKRFIGAAVAEGHLRPVVDRIFPFDQALDAYAYMESGAQKGKIVVAVG